MSWKTGANSWRISWADSVSPIWCAACDAFKPRGRAWSVLQDQWSSCASYQWRFVACRFLHKLCTRQKKATRSNHVHCNIISIFATTMQEQQIRSIVCCWVVSYLLLPGTIQASVYIEVYKLVGWSCGWWRCWCCCRNIVYDPAASTRTEFCECLSTTPAAAIAPVVRRRVVDRSARWLCCCSSMQITAPHSWCSLPFRW
jgi:hypothetical protein